VKTELPITLILFLSVFSILIAQGKTSEVQIDTAYSFDKIPIIYQEVGSGNQVLVFVHCWSCDKSYWAGQLEYFKNKYSVYIIDLAGHGESGLKRTEWTIENYARDVVAVIVNENLNDVILIGHSMGGPVVLKAAHLMDDKVKAIITIDTFQDIEGRWSDEQFEEFIKPFEEDFINTTKGFVKSIFDQNADSNLVQTISNDMSSAPPDVALFSFRSLFRFDEAANFDKINPPDRQKAIPVRFINSDKYPTNAETAKRHIKDFELKIIDNVGHFPMLENPKEFNRILEETIKEIE